jgi:putative flippase GtrA
VAVDLSPSSVLAHAKSPEGRKQLRYAGVSMVFVPVGQILVQLIYWLLVQSKPTSILISAAILTIPNYFANKTYVWRDTSRDKLHTQITVFWIAAMLGTGFAMGLAAIAEVFTRGAAEIWQAFWLFAAQLGGYGIVWVGRYLFLDRFIFKVTHHGEEPDEDDLDMMHGDLPV